MVKLLYFQILCTLGTTASLHGQQWYRNWKTIDSAWYNYNGEMQAGSVLGIQCPDTLNCISFGIAQAVYLRYTSDGGKNWQTSYGDTLSGSNSARIIDAFAYPSLGLCLAVGRYKQGLGALILRSTDRGISWQKIDHKLGSQRGLPDISMHDDLNGIVMNGFDSLIATSDGGLSWYVVPPPEPDHHPSFNGVYCLRQGTFLTWGIRNSAIKQNKQLMLHAYERAIYRTDDNGKHWSSFIFLDSIHPDEPDVFNNPDYYYAAVPSKMMFFDSLSGIAIGTRNTLANGYSGKSVIMLTSDGGRSWRTVLHEARCSHSMLFSGISFCDRMNGMVTGNQLMLMRTTDGGETWLEECIDPNIYLFLSGVSYKSRTWAMGSAATGQIVKWLGPVDRAEVPQEGLRREKDIAGTAASASVSERGIKIRYRLSRITEVRIRLLSTTGQELTYQDEGMQKPGEYESQLRAEGLSSGTYFIRVDAGSVIHLLPVQYVR